MVVQNLSPVLIASVAFMMAAAPHAIRAEPSSPHLLFPPSNCSATELRVMAWQDGAPSTTCLTAQQILILALPGCRAQQHIIFDGNNFTCKDAAAPVAMPKK